MIRELARALASLLLVLALYAVVTAACVWLGRMV